MAHFAELDENNTVLRVIVVSNGDLLDTSMQENEELGITFCKKLFGEHTRWVQTSYNRSFRRYYAGPGHTYNPEKDVFCVPKPFETWVLDDDLNWIPPIAKPEVPTGYFVEWDEENQEWDVMIDRGEKRDVYVMVDRSNMR